MFKLLNSNDMEKQINKLLSYVLLTNIYVKTALVIVSALCIYKFGKIVGNFASLLFN